MITVLNSLISKGTYTIGLNDFGNGILNFVLTKMFACIIWCSTGSTIRNWYKVKTWLDQIFWQIYQKLMSSGFLSSGSLCLIHYFNFFWPHAASTASDRKGAKIQHNFSWFCQKNFFSKRQNKVIVVLKIINSRTKMTLQSSVVIFQALETSPASLTSVASATSLASTASKAQFPPKNYLILMVWSSLALK